MAITFDVPNLDDQSADDLEQLGRVLDKLSRYAIVKSQAMKRRAEGEIAEALERESVADGVYERLPYWARW